jgi:hypothetical protein
MGEVQKPSDPLRNIVHIQVTLIITVKLPVLLFIMKAVEVHDDDHGIDGGCAQPLPAPQVFFSTCKEAKVFPVLN